MKYAIRFYTDSDFQEFRDTFPDLEVPDEADRVVICEDQTHIDLAIDLGGWEEIE